MSAETDRKKIEAKIVELREHIGIAKNGLAILRQQLGAGKIGTHFADAAEAPLRTVLRREEKHLEALELTLVAKTVEDGKRVAVLLNESDLADLEAHQELGLIPEAQVFH